VAEANLAALRIHDLRHTTVALWIAAGASPKEVAARAGDTSVSFVLDRYGHLFPEADTALRARLDLLFRGATEHGRLEREQNGLSLTRFERSELG
jgi:integrase